MFLTICKRDGRQVDFDESKITEAIFKAAQSVGGVDKQLAMELTLEVLKLLQAEHGEKLFSVEDVQDTVEKVLIETGHARTAKAYILYRDKRTRIRDAKSDLMDVVDDILQEPRRETGSTISPSGKMLRIAGAASKAYYLNRLLPDKIASAHVNGDIHIHDLEVYAQTLGSVNIPLGRLLRNGFNNGYGYIRPPKRPASVAALAAIILQSSQNDMHGDQSFAFFDSDVAPFIDKFPDEDIYQAMEALVYDLNNLHSRAGAKAPLSNISVGLDMSDNGRRVTKNLLLAYERGLGKGENPLFPHIVFKVQDGINFKNGDPNYDLFKLAIRVAAQRINPTFCFLDSSFNRDLGGEVAYTGSQMRLAGNVCGPNGVNGRGCLSCTTLNLPRLALRCGGNIRSFYQDLYNLIDLVIEQHLHRFSLQAKLKVRDMPFLMGEGLYLGSDKLQWDDTIGGVIKNGVMLVGFVGLAETLLALIGAHHGEKAEAQSLGEEIVAFMNDKMDKAAKKYNLNFALAATAAENVAGRFLKLDRAAYGGVIERDFYTNSFHIPVDFPLNAYSRLELEGVYHKYTLGGHISYVKFDAPPVNNLQAVEEIVKYMKSCDIGYAGINFPVDFCENCGYYGLINAEICPSCRQPKARQVKRILA